MRFDNRRQRPSFSSSDMLQVVVQHDEFCLALRAYAASAKFHLIDFIEHLPADFVVTSSMPSACWSLTLVSPVALPLNDINGPGSPNDNIWSLLHKAWAGMESEWKGSSLLNFETESSDHQNTDFIYLLPEKPKSPGIALLLQTYIFRLNKEWLVKRGWFLVHAAAVALGNQGFLFLGESGAGKSTVSKFSREVSGQVLHDDKIFIVEQRGYYSLIAAPNPNRIVKLDERNDKSDAVFQSPEIIFNPNLKVPLSAIFLLIKDDQDYLLPLSGLTAARALVDGLLVASDHLISSDRDMSYLMRALCAVARKVPAFELHFRKSHDFWKLINERFPG